MTLRDLICELMKCDINNLDAEVIAFHEEEEIINEESTGRYVAIQDDFIEVTNNGDCVQLFMHSRPLMEMDCHMMKVKDLGSILSNFTTCKIVESGVNEVWKGYTMDIPKEYTERYIDCVIPIINPDNTKIGMCSIILVDNED